MTTSVPWWQNGVIYQIYPKSFQDSTGNGVGDIRGIISRLGYLQRLGVDAIWITPVYLSPQVDNGYDVAGYCVIDPAYGTMEDMERLIAEAHQRRIRILMDMVFNHTSTQHCWFQAAQERRSAYRHFYIWRDGNGKAPPNNWRAKCGGSAWRWHAASQQYYLHLFTIEQADLNWEHPRVRGALKKVCEFWADKGIDGLRLNAISLISKQPDFPDDEQGDGERYYTDGPRIHDYLQEFSQEVFQPRGLMTAGEMLSASLEHARRYAALDGSELSMIFNSQHLEIDYANGEKQPLTKPDFIKLKQIMNRWQQGMYQHAWNSLFWCNHNQPRIVSRFGDEGEFRIQSAKMLAMILHGMQGTPYIYQGEEIGMTNPGYTTLSQYQDTESLNRVAEQHDGAQSDEQPQAILAARSCDNSRTPMQWNNSENAGFTAGVPWLQPCENYPQINTEQALADQNSVFYTYQQLIMIRKTLPLVIQGNYQDLLPDHPAIWCYQRCWNGQRLLVLANLAKQPQLWQPSPAIITDNRRWRLLLSNYADAAVHPATLTIRAFEAIYWVQGIAEKEDKV
ncbi:trehalose-6-phosphate hydrolase|uniref:Trehalose-6-phosphate hydrolase n=1 Tax=Brenneria salicis ATCC 15712 = DSM 30166 TaxID=714314 RepID=A0A366IBV0_9GAMM|nr:alpha,alpha-phosphotrehalase [Brenneria salicis]NMN91078.1 trehalose-6-phosphate hydrolase [Brenneria salicis ATCC 15712 = DSM 30166]RBP66574.1 trehalose-6-phosphate hydrolase [Brenneria salicis ATCC 15712 = DSM 30166]RLM31979.1 alpha,alpha-phosphotrehalase [Brenneria salicis ATCC 15712 = DSM 30166]